jgi:hypothetical protein
VSADRSVREIGGLAYTVGSSIAFRRGLYDPRTRAGQAILAHELAHVVQQSSASPDGPVSAEQSEHEEREARAAARAVLRGATANISTRRRSRAVRRVTATEDLRDEPEISGLAAALKDPLYVDNDVVQVRLVPAPGGPGALSQLGAVLNPTFIGFTIKYADGSVLGVPLDFLRGPATGGQMTISRFARDPASKRLFALAWRGTPAEMMLAKDPRQLRGQITFSKELTPNVMMRYDWAIIDRASAYTQLEASIWQLGFGIKGAIQFFTASQMAVMQAARQRAISQQAYRSAMQSASERIKAAQRITPPTSRAAEGGGAYVYKVWQDPTSPRIDLKPRRYPVLFHASNRAVTPNPEQLGKTGLPARGAVRDLLEYATAPVLETSRYAFRGCVVPGTPSAFLTEGDFVLRLENVEGWDVRAAADLIQKPPGLQTVIFPEAEIAVDAAVPGAKITGISYVTNGRLGPWLPLEH